MHGASAQRAPLAIVTGANRGIGREVARQLLKGGLDVVLTARDAEKGEAVVAALCAEGLSPAFHVLDVARDASVAAFADWLRHAHGRCDVLVNNAGIAIDGWDTPLENLPLDVLQRTLDTNLFGVLRVARALLPLMRAGGYGRIVNLSSGMGQLSDMQAGAPAYRISKTALNAATRILARELADGDFKVNSMCPGWVRTDMGGPNATRSVQEGADTAVWLATLAEDGPTGGFFRDRQPIPW
ncbi:MAG: SDR family oxidoreductase [Betaproteobacteria bacterium]|nr:SDR family oxidoreductase [Betaproteobacteria bacterium]